MPAEKGKGSGEVGIDGHGQWASCEPARAKWLVTAKVIDRNKADNQIHSNNNCVSPVFSTQGRASLLLIC